LSRRSDGQHIQERGYRALLTDVNGALRWAAGLWDILGSFDEEIPEAAAEVKQRSREDRANALKDQEPGARIDIGMGLALKGKAERNKKHQRNREVFQILGHSCSLGRMSASDYPTWSEDADGKKKFRFATIFLTPSFRLSRF
jgi:hypothetical protein